MKSTLNDAATTSLMEHMSYIDKQRRLIVMKQKEVETKLAFAEQECKELMKQHEIFNDEEMKLKIELEKLLYEQQQLQLRVMTDVNRVRRAEEEEPLLTKHVEEKLNSILAELPRCMQKVEQVNELHESWLVSEQRNLLETKWKECSHVYLTLSKEKELLQQEVSKQRDMLNELQKQRYELFVEGQDKQYFFLHKDYITNNRNNCHSGNIVNHCINSNNVKELTTELTNNFANEERQQQAVLSSTLIKETYDAEKSEREQLQVEIQEFEYQLEQTNAQNARQIGMIQREVNDLTCRAQELGQWLHDMEITKQQLTSCANNFDRCFSSGVCIFCLDH